MSLNFTECPIHLTKCQTKLSLVNNNKQDKESLENRKKATNWTGDGETAERKEKQKRQGRKEIKGNFGWTGGGETWEREKSFRQEKENEERKRSLERER